MPRKFKEYGFNGLAGCVIQRVSRETGTLVGLYQADQAGMESDPETPWATVCEAHGTLVCHPSLALAKEHLGYPTNWCDECQEKSKEPEFQNPSSAVEGA